MRSLNVFRCLVIPTTHIVEDSMSLHVTPNEVNVLALLSRLFLSADKRRIPKDVATLLRRQNSLPVRAESIFADDGGRLLEWQSHEVLAECLCQPEVHLVVHQPHCNLGDAGGPFTDLNPVKSIYVHE